MVEAVDPSSADKSDQKDQSQGLVVGGIDFEDMMFVAQRKYQQYLDKWQFYPGRRWAAFGVALGFFLIRMYVQQGYAVVAYLLGLFYLNHIFLYLAPAEDPEEQEFSMIDSDFVLPTREADEYKGFQRKLQENELWKNLMQATLIADFASCFQGADIEIFWPLLLFYFIFMTCFLCRVKLEHMVKHRYVPFEIGKKNYNKPGQNFAQSHFN